MVFRMFLFLLVFFLLLGLARFWHLYWPHQQPSHSKGGAMRTTVQRLLKPRTPLDCPACRLSCTPSSGVRPAPARVRPWREVKSRRGAPKRVNTEDLPVPTSNARTPGSQMHTSTRWSGMARMVMPSASRRFAASPAIRLSTALGRLSASHSSPVMA